LWWIDGGRVRGHDPGEFGRHYNTDGHADADDDYRDGDLDDEYDDREQRHYRYRYHHFREHHGYRYGNADRNRD
jgi:hypothetical protein